MMAKKPLEYVEIEIDGTRHRVRKDQYVLWSARELGYDIPHFCAHKWLEPFAGCRMCLVKVEVGGRMMPKLQTSCSLLPTEGMKIFTRDPEVLQARREQLEFHLLNHPLECPVCDKGGECMLQDQTRDHGMFSGRFQEQKRIRPDAVFNHYIRMNYKRCIHCKRCIHYCQDVDGSHLLKFIQRGAETFIESFPDPEIAPRFSGNVIDMCPVGALTARNYRFSMGRPWEQELRPTVGSLDSVGANLWICGRLGQVARVVPRGNPEIENGLIDDVTRFSWECTDDNRRLTKGIIRDGDGEHQVSRQHAEEEAAKVLARVVHQEGPDCVGVIAGNGLNTEEYLALRHFCGSALDTQYFHFGDEYWHAGVDPVVLQSLACEGASINDILSSSAVLALGCDLFEEAPALGLRLDLAARRGYLKLVSARSHGSDFDRFATAFVDYGYGNLLRLVRALTNALRGEGETTEEARQLASALREVGDDCAILYGHEIWKSGDPAELIRALSALRSAMHEANSSLNSVSLNAIYPAVNSVGALLVTHLEQFTVSSINGSRPSAGSLSQVLEETAAGRLKALLVVDSDLINTYPNRKLVERAFAVAETVIVCEPFPTLTGSHANLQLPLGTWAHREGTVISLEWRLQKRSRSTVSSEGPSVLDVLNSITSMMGTWPAGDTMERLHRELSELLATWPEFSLTGFPLSGVALELTPGRKQELDREAVFPEQVNGTTERPFVLVPKRFLYNSRPEIAYSKIFNGVTKPFYAYVNPADMASHGLSSGQEITLVGDLAKLSLAVQPASWVRVGSIVVNDYFSDVPVNGICLQYPGQVTLEIPVQASGS